MSQNYHEDMKSVNVVRLRAQLALLPPFLDVFFRGIADTKAPRTRVGYAKDLRLFFAYLVADCPKFQGLTIQTFTLEHMKDITADHIERFMEHLNLYTTQVGELSLLRTNAASGKGRKLAAVRTMFGYYYKKQYILANPAVLVDFPSLHQKNIVKLEVEEVARLLDVVETGATLKGQTQAYHNHTKERDLALVTLFLGTGMRVSECVGLNAEHVDFEQMSVKVVRKGGDEAMLYFSQEVGDALLAYMTIRENIVPHKGHESALFFSMQKKRMGDQAIRNLVKKYAKIVTRMKKITPHKLRSTFGTSLYNETGDIYLVAEVLGHSDVNTTTKHYVQLSDERRRSAASAVKLRKD